MTAEAILTLVISGFVAAIMIGIGIFQLRSVTPVGFYTGEKPPAAEELTDVRAWNRKHGMMWLLYGITILISSVGTCFLGDSLWSMIPYCIGFLVPIVIMIWYHHRLTKKYRKNERK